MSKGSEPLDAAALHQALDRLAHDLRGPLAWLKSNAAYLKSVVTPLGDEDADGALADIQLAEHELAFLLDNLNCVAAAIHDEPLSTGSCNLAAVVDSQLHHVEQQLVDRSIRIEKNGLDRFVAIGFDHMALVMRNLLTASARFAPSDSVVKLNAETTATGISVTIADDGPAVPSELLTLRGASGEGLVRYSRGLGLYCASAVLARHGSALVSTAASTCHLTFELRSAE